MRPDLHEMRSPLVRRVQAFTVKGSAPAATANGLPPDPAYKLASEHLRRLANTHPAHSHDVQRHAA